MTLHRRPLEKSIIAVLVLVAVFLVVPPFGRLGPQIPRPAALSGFEHWGCGQSDLDAISVTVIYTHLKADRRIRQSIHDELISKAFKLVRRSKSVSYRKSTGWLFPIHSWVSLYDNGRVSTGASRSKWEPF